MVKHVRFLHEAKQMKHYEIDVRKSLIIVHYLDRELTKINKQYNDLNVSWWDEIVIFHRKISSLEKCLCTVHYLTQHPILWLLILLFIVFFLLHFVCIVKSKR